MENLKLRIVQQKDSTCPVKNYNQNNVKQITVYPVVPPNEKGSYINFCNYSQADNGKYSDKTHILIQAGYGTIFSGTMLDLVYLIEKSNLTKSSVSNNN